LVEPFAVYSRIAFDTFLRERARKAGSTVLAEKVSARACKRTGDGWIVRTQTDAEFSGKHLLAADGANSAIAKKLAGPLPPAEMEVAFGYRAPLPEVGDAAGFADPVTGEGIYYALRSAELFAQAYLAGEPLAYEQSWRKDFGAELRRASQMRRRFYGNFWGAPFTDRMIKFARGHRGIR